MDNLLKFGKRPIGVYLSNIMEIFEGNHRAIVRYVEARRERVNVFFQKLENGGFLISREYEGEKEYTKLTCFFQNGNKRAIVEYFPEDDNLRIRGELPKELRNDETTLIKVLEEKGMRQQNKTLFFWREVNKK